jgi:hypothetical protein
LELLRASMPPFGLDSKDLLAAGVERAPAEPSVPERPALDDHPDRQP